MVGPGTWRSGSGRATGQEPRQWSEVFRLVFLLILSRYTHIHKLLFGNILLLKDYRQKQNKTEDKHCPMLIQSGVENLALLKNISQRF